MIKTVLFDTDGTLLPMDLDKFTKCYFKHLIAYVAPLGYEPQAVYGAVMKGVGEMTDNDGSSTNEEAFWRGFLGVLGEEAIKYRPGFDRFYVTDFDKAKEVCGFQPLVAPTVAKIKDAGLRMAIASNPLFPLVAQEARVRWAGLNPADFEHVTAYENSSYAKPNPGYFREILQKLNLKAEETLMVGNDVGDDMPAEKLGMKVFLLTDCLINRENTDISQYPHGDFNDLWAFIQENK